LPQIGIEAALARRFAVKIQGAWLMSPSSPAIVATAVARTIWSIAASETPHIIPTRTIRRRAGEITGLGRDSSAGMGALSACRS
jgi:hypothetical protein